MTPDAKSTPNETLAALIAKDVVQSGLVPAAKSDELLAKLTAGTATAEDWRLYVELAISQSEAASSNAKTDADQ